MGSEYKDIVRLMARIAGSDGLVVAFSGGVDSGLVAAAAQEAIGERAEAVTVVSELSAPWDVALAERSAALIGIRHKIVRLSMLDDPEIAVNNPDRCYRCKKRMLAALTEFSGTVVDGTNADDDPQRPGRRALREFGARSPLEELGLGKADVRRIAASLGLASADRPSESCLATRFPKGVVLTSERLRMIAELEELVRARGHGDVRVRWMPDGVRVELPEAELPVSERDASAIVRKAAALGCATVEYGRRPPKRA